MSGWYQQLSKVERRTFWACFAGWGLDAMDTQMYALSIPVLIALWGLTKTDAGVLGTAVLVMAALGGWIGGQLADRYGRVRILQFTILWFATFTFLTAFAHSYWSLLTVRSLEGLGFGGEWAVGSALISETIRPAVRGRVVGAIQAGWAIGYAIAVILSTVLFSYFSQAVAWQLFFMLGATPALLVIWIRRHVVEAPIYVEHRASMLLQGKPVAAPVWSVLAGGNLWTTVRAIMLTSGIYGGNYVLITWLPTYLRMERHLSVLNTGANLAVNITGSFCGAFVNGWMADALGRRRTFIIIAACQIVTVASFTLAPVDSLWMLPLTFILGLLQSGTAAGTSAFIAELFATRIRAAALGFCGNGGRAIGATAPALVGALSAHYSLGAAMAGCACSAYVLVMLAAMLLPETRGREISA
jgi:MFS family permease